MARLTLSDDSVQLRFTTTEKILGLVKDQDFPRSAVQSARVEQDGLHATQGVRAPGLGVPGYRKVGTWRGKGRSLVSVRRHEPAVVVELSGQRVDRLVVGVDGDASALAAALSGTA
ncbi:hypothetical protein [Nocardioides marmoribigeumensis]|uniref:Bacterial Pleckstrin homology domain-containing protein n=1 Tax=Nocardioides marmoribigeumensis TaxID=433649 RepID=A0ABU2BU30_9ACTN|nr:hypothetical protein [Nocardioides marmoribigeumensis]MDR7362127.1 hypothetical protein [Nocardioides marmoribigeumensis]